MAGSPQNGSPTVTYGQKYCRTLADGCLYVPTLSALPITETGSIFSAKVLRVASPPPRTSKLVEVLPWWGTVIMTTCCRYFFLTESFTTSLTWYMVVAVASPVTTNQALERGNPSRTTTESVLMS